MPYYFVLQNSTVFAFSSISAKLFSGLSYVMDMPDNEEYELLPGDRHTVQTKLVCKYRGEYEVGVKEIVITDFLRLFRFRYKVPGTIKAIVYPRIIHKNELVTIGEIAAFQCRETFDKQTEPDVVVRDYIAGDTLKMIHWKATAREQKLKTRTLTGEEKQRHDQYEIEEEEEETTSSGETAEQTEQTEPEEQDSYAGMVWSGILAAVMVCLLALWVEQRMFQRRFARMSGEQKFLLEVKRNLWLLSKLGVTRKEAETLEELGERAKDKLSYLPAIEKGFAFLQGYEEYLYRTDRVSDVTLQMAVEEREQILSWLKCSHRLRYYRMVFRLRFIR